MKYTMNDLNKTEKTDDNTLYYDRLMVELSLHENFRSIFEILQKKFQNSYNLFIRFEYSLYPNSKNITSEIAFLQEEFKRDKALGLVFYLFKDIMVIVFTDGSYHIYPLKYIWFENISRLQEEIIINYFDFNNVYISQFKQRGSGYYTQEDIDAWHKRIEVSNEVNKGMQKHLDSIKALLDKK